MTLSSVPLRDFLAVNAAVIQVEITEIAGSVPREVGASLFVSLDQIQGTIGGGQLELHAISKARDMLTAGALQADLDIPLGDEIGQCCGGRVKLSLTRMRESDRENALDAVAKQQANAPHVYILGAGHVGRALALQFQYLPLRVIVVDPRADEIGKCTAAVETRVSAMPEIDIDQAPSGSAYIMTTHEHGLDFLLTSTALKRGDASYVGMIGSKTKRAKFENWVARNCEGLVAKNLVCPIGGAGKSDKRPSVIAAFVVAEVLSAIDAQLTTKKHSDSNSMQDMLNIQKEELTKVKEI